jgi:hypothetical protein
MQIYDIRKYNIPAHVDLERDITRVGNGLLSFTIKVNNGNITDYIVMEYSDYSKLLPYEDNGKSASSCNS